MLPVSLDYPFFIGPSVFSNVYLHVILLDAKDHIGGVMVSLIASSVVDRGFESRSDQNKDYEIGICCSIMEKEQRLVGSESG